MTFGSGAARKEPLYWIITTAGDDPDKKSIGWEVHEYARRVMDGEIEDPFWYVKIYSAPDDCDIFDEANWYRANPSLGVTIEIENVRQEAIGARNDPAKEKLFRWLRLNQWVQLKRIGWLPITLWDKTQGGWGVSELVGKKCYAGLDLSRTVDLTGLVLIFPPQEGIDGFRFISEGWIPEDKMKERMHRDHVPFDRWVNQKHMHATPGDTIDYRFIKSRIKQVHEQYDLIAIGTDPWNCQMLRQELENEIDNLKMVSISQDMHGMSPAMKELEHMMLRCEITHEENPAARWCFGNVIIATDGNENIKPMKNRSIGRIDITVALINGMAIMIEMGGNKISVYEKRGMLSLL
jgi:phage terminase large subunit-like protein